MKRLAIILLFVFTNSFAAASFDDLFNPEQGNILNDIPPPEEAFVPSITHIDDDSITVHYRIAKDTYLYQKSLEFEGAGLTLGPPQMPPGDVVHDPFFGDVAVYHDDLNVTLPVLKIDQPSFSLTLKFQGCHEIGFCYPPQTETLTIQSANGQNGILNLLRTSNTTWVLLGFLGFGLLLALTPCVLPMVPILSALILTEQQHHHRLKALYLAITYVIAMAITYSILGAIVATLGQHLQAQLQNPIVLSITAGILLLMAFFLLNDKALHKLAHLNHPIHKLSNKLEGGRFFTVAVMGFISALVISPCVTPPLVGALTYISLTGDVLLGGSALFMLGLGMGIPLIAVCWLGTNFMPKRGPWMSRVKHFLSVLLIGMAITLLDRFLPDSITLALWGVLTLGIAFWIGFWPLRKSAIERLYQAIAWVALVYGSICIIGAGMGNTDLRHPLVTCKQIHPTQSTLPFVYVDDLQDLQAKLKQATDNNQRVMLDFYADWCTACLVMERTVFTDETVQSLLSDVILLKADVTNYNDDSKIMMQQYQIFGPPAYLFFDPQGQEQQQFRAVGEMSVPAFIQHLESWKSA